jgi:hypothetical protein
MDSEFAVALATFKAAPKRKAKLSAVHYARRLALEKALQQKRYCDAFGLWRTCRRSACRRRYACSGDANACLKRALARIPHQTQWQKRQNILEATPPNIGKPERSARQCMPRDFYE